jgi:transcriptional regulator with XRE-family HTH domain
LNRGTISRYLSGKYEPKADQINKLAKALNCSEMWLWGYKVPRERSEKQKKNDKISKAISRIRDDTEFAEMIIALDDLDEEKLASIKQLITVFSL